AILWVEEVGADRVPRPEDLDPGHVADGVVPTQGHERARATGQARDGLGAVGIARRLGVGAREPGHRGNLAELLAAQPAHLVELVDAHVPEDPAAAGAKLRARRLPVPLRAGVEVDLPELALLDALTQFLQRGHV